jgi:hypothetical protein
MKSLLNQLVDVLFALITLGLAIWSEINPEKNFTVFLWVVFGYVINVIRNKVIIAGKM